jgi:hypothetical protein
MNRFHRYLNIPDYYPNVDFSQWNVANLKWVEFHKSLKFRDLNNDKIEEWLNSLGLTSKWIEVFFTPPNDSGIIHSDNTSWDDWAKIIYQFGADGSRMRWWESDKLTEYSTSLEHIQNISYTKKYRNDSHYHGQVLTSSEEESNLVYEVELDKASLVNVGPLHSSYNPTNDKRFVITIALFDLENKQRVLWDDAIEIMSDYIVS